MVALRSLLRTSGESCLNEPAFDRGSVIRPPTLLVGNVRITPLRVPSGVSRALRSAVLKRFFPDTWEGAKINPKWRIEDVSHERIRPF